MPKVKKLLLVEGLHRQKGNTVELAKFAEEYLDSLEVSYDTVKAVNGNKSCVHCGRCASTWSCVITDSYTPTLIDQDTFSGILFITPVYFFSLPATVKAYLERMGSCEYWDFSIGLIAVSGSAGVEGGVDLIDEMFLRTCDYHGSYYVGSYNKVTGDRVLPLTEQDKEGVKSIINQMLREG